MVGQMPFPMKVHHRNEPMRPPTRKLSNNFSEEEEEDECHQVVTPWVFHKKEDSRRSLHSTSTNQTCSTAAETVVTSSSDGIDTNHRSVRFAMTVKKYWVYSHNMYSPEEKADCWYSPEERSKRTKKVEKIVARMEAGKLEKRSCPYRGLECWTEKCAASLEAHIFEVLNAVMDEQDQQWLGNVTDEERIACISRNVTAKNVEKALNAAYQDELAAAAIYGASNTHNGLGCDEDSSVGSSIASLSSAKSKSKKKKTRRSGRKRSDAPPRRTKRKSSKSRKADHQDPPGVKSKSKKRVTKKNKE